MKTLYWLTLLIFLPGVCLGADLAVEDSLDWQPMNQDQLKATTGKVVQAGGQVVDGSVMQGRGGGATLISVPMSRGVNKASVDSFVISYVQGVERSGPKLVDREATKIGSLPGTSLLFLVERNGRKASMVSSVVFTNQLCYLVMCYLPAEGTRADPMVKSYLARIKVASAAIPGNISNPASVNLDSIAFHIGEAAGVLIVLLALGGGLFAVVGASLTRRKTVAPPPLPRT